MNDIFKYLFQVPQTQTQAKGLLGAGTVIGDTLYPQGWRGGLLGAGNPTYDAMSSGLLSANQAKADVLKRSGNEGRANAAYQRAMLLATRDMARDIASGFAGGGMTKMAGAAKKSLDEIAEVFSSTAHTYGPKGVRRAGRNEYGLDETEAQKLWDIVERRRAQNLAKEREYYSQPVVQQQIAASRQALRAEREAADLVAAQRAAEQMKQWGQTAQMWRSDRRAAVENLLRSGQDLAAEQAAKSATLEAITRMSKSAGAAVGHVSKSRAGTASSRYLDLSKVHPQAGRVRVSDHPLPETPQREYMREQGVSGNWKGEVVIEPEMLENSPDWWRRALLLAATGKKSFP